MCRLIRLLAGATVAASVSLALLPGAALSAGKGKVQAFNPQPDPPGKGAKHILGPNTKGSWKSYHEVDKSKSKGSWKSYHDVEEKFKNKGSSKAKKSK